MALSTLFALSALSATTGALAPQPAQSASQAPSAAQPSSGGGRTRGGLLCNLTGRWSGHWPADYRGGIQAGDPSSVVHITARDVAAGKYTAFVSRWKPPHQPLQLFRNGSIALTTGIGISHGTARPLNSSTKACSFIVIGSHGSNSWCLYPLCPIGQPRPRPPSPPPSSAPTEPWPPLHGYDADALPARNLSLDPLVRYAWNASVDSNVMQTYRRKATKLVAAEPAAGFDGLASVLSDAPQVIIKPGASLCLDFGLETAGWIEFQSPDLGKAGSAAANNVAVGMGEYNSPDKVKSSPVLMANSIDTFLTCYEACGPSNYEGVRFVWFSLAADAAGPMTLTNITVVAQIRPISYVGSFSSSNEMLDRIFYTGAYGVRVNMHPATLGSILYDRGDRKAFQGDNMVASAVAEAVFGAQAFPLVLANIKSTNSGNVKQGIPKDYAGHGESGVHDSNLVPYPLYWAQTVCDYLWASNDTRSFRYFSPNIAQILTSHATTAVKSWLNVQLNFYGWDDRVRVGSGERGYGILGPYPGLEPQLAYVSLLVQSCRYFARTLNATNGDTGLAANITAIAEELTAKIRARPSSGGAPYWKDYGVHASANLLAAGVPTAVELPLIASNVFNSSASICSYSPFNTYFILKGMAMVPDGVRYGNAAAQLCWENMVKSGRGCFWENDDPMWSDFMQDGDKPPGNPSLCHPWASGVTQWLSQHTLGVSALVPGHASFVAIPFVSEDLRSVAGDVPTHRGPIHVDAEWGELGIVRVVVTAAAPGYYIGVLHRHTAVGGDLIGVTIDGVEQMVDVAANFKESDSVLSGALSASQIAERWFTKRLPPGRHVLLARYTLVDTRESSARASMLLAPASFPVTSFNDTQTRGNAWQEAWGSDGYVLFGYDKQNGKSRMLFPSYVSNVTWSLGGGPSKTPVFDCGANDTRCLQDPIDKTKRSLGGASGQVVDINSSLGYQYKLAIYSVGLMTKNSLKAAVPVHSPSQSLRILDLSPGSSHLNPVAASIHVHDFEDGVWWVLNTDRPLRIRIDTQYGSPLINALAFSQ